MTPLSHDLCYDALLARDRRFDGVFFIAVRTTGIYCRPICTAKTPGKDRVRFFSTAAECERANFRPCLRCRPELAPGNANCDAAGRLARTVVARIEEGALTDSSFESLSEELGVTSRHLRRVVEQEVGASPVELLQTQRLLMAKRLLTETRLPMTEVAFASGFASLRRFNALFLERYRMSPTRLRRDATESPPGESLTLAMHYRPPFDWQQLLGFLAYRAIPGVEVVEGDTYRRTLRIGTATGWVAVRPGKGHALNLALSGSLVRSITPVLSTMRRVFDLDAQPIAIEQHLARCERMAPIVERQPGVRVPGAVDGFELGLRAILGQQVSVRGATTLAGRLTAKYGDPIETPWPGLTHLAPTAAAIAEAGSDGIVGMPRKRAETIAGFARAVADGTVRLRPGADPDATIAALVALPGIGPWTAHYMAMRVLRWPDAFPHADLGIMKALGVTKPAESLALSEAWRPWRSYAALHLWQSLSTREEVA